MVGRRLASGLFRLTCTQATSRRSITGFQIFAEAFCGLVVKIEVC
jgi:hypothetical protein